MNSSHLRTMALVAASAAVGACHDSAASGLAALPSPIHVEATPAQARPMPRVLPLTGSLVANQQADVAANASGRVLKTFVERGALVKAEASLVQLDMLSASLSHQEARANLQNAEAQQELAAAQCTRNQELLNKGAISKDEWDRINSACRTSVSSATAAKARVELANKTLSDATVRAPFAGMISERFVSAGEYVQPQTKVATLVELDPLRLQLTIAEADLGSLHEGQKVDFTVQAYNSQTFVGTVRYIGPAMRSSTRDLVVEAMVPNNDHRLRPGMFASASLELPDEAMPTVPQSAVRRDGSTSHLFTVVNGRLEERAVQVGPERNGFVAILDGLRTGESVVTQLSSDVKDGVPVN